MRIVAEEKYRKGDSHDYFGLEAYRRIVYASEPAHDEEEMDLQPFNTISHLTIYQLAFVELKASLATDANHV